MQITIDTKHDSHDDIKKVIKLLSHLIGDQEIRVTVPIVQEAPIIQDPTLQMTEGTFNAIFADHSAKKKNEQLDSEPDPKIEFYN